MFQITVIFTLIVQRFLKIKNVGKIKNVKKRVFIEKDVYKRLLQLWSFLHFSRKTVQL